MAAAGGPAWLAIVMVVLYGAMAFPIYTIAVTHANDLVDTTRAVEVSGGLLLVFSIGATIGPLMAALWMQALGPGALFLHTATAHVLLAMMIGIRVVVRRDLPTRFWGRFVVFPRSTPEVFGLDPRAEPVADPPSGQPGARATTDKP